MGDVHPLPEFQFTSLFSCAGGSIPSRCSDPLSSSPSPDPPPLCPPTHTCPMPTSTDKYLPNNLNITGNTSNLPFLSNKFEFKDKIFLEVFEQVHIPTQITPIEQIIQLCLITYITICRSCCSCLSIIMFVFSTINYLFFFIIFKSGIFISHSMLLILFLWMRWLC
jgi:hypothetical protein